MHLKRSAASALLVIVAIGLGVLLAGLLASRLVHRDASLQAIASGPAAPVPSPSTPWVMPPAVDPAPGALASTPTPAPTMTRVTRLRTAAPAHITPAGPPSRSTTPLRKTPASAGAEVIEAPVTEPLPVVAQPSMVQPAPSALIDEPRSSTAPPPTPGGPGPATSTPQSPPSSTPSPTPTPTPPRMRTVWSCPDGGELVGTSCITTTPYTFHTETADYTFHEESTPYTFHRETRYGQPCSYLPNPSAPGGLDIFCTQYSVDVRDSTPAGWRDNGSTWVRQVRDGTPVGWTDTGTQWTRQVRDSAPEGFTDDGSQWRRVTQAASHEVPA